MNNCEKETAYLKKLAIDIRIETIRMIAHTGKGHIGGSMSLAEVLAVLYGVELHINPQNPKWEARDRLVLSKGHCGPALYAALALTGFFPLEWLKTMNQMNTRLPSHANALLTPGVDVSTGSLGQGLSVAVGMALAAQLQKREFDIFCILGDGECQERQIWEAALYAGSHKLNHLIILIDRNKRQCTGYVNEITNLDPYKEKWLAFGFHTHEVNGHQVEEIQKAIQKARKEQGPVVIILNTEKGKGCSFAENLRNNHSIPVTQQQMEEAVEKLLRQRKEVYI